MRRRLDLGHCANEQEAVIAAYVEELEENDRTPKGLGRTSLDLSEEVTGAKVRATVWGGNHSGKLILVIPLGMTESTREISERGLEELKALLMQALEEAARFKGRERQAARGDRAAQGLEGTSAAQAQWHGEGGGCRQERGAEGPDAARDHRRNEIALPRSLAIDQFLEPSRRMAMRTASTCPCGSERMHSRRPSAGASCRALEHQPDSLSLFQRQGRQVGDGALLDALALPDAFAQQDGRL